MPNNKDQYCWHVPGSITLYDIITDDGLTQYGRKTDEEVLQKEPKAIKRRLDDDLLDELDQLADQNFVTSPVEITKDYFWEKLEVLPPMKWNSLGSTETFMISEAMFSNIRSIYCRIGDRHFELCVSIAGLVIVILNYAITIS